MHRAIILAASILIFAASPARAQSAAPDSRTDAILTAARQQMAKGEACLAAGDVECARREFDGAVDYVFEQGIDVRSDPRLRAGLMEIIEKIYRYETQPASEQTARLWKSQEYEGRPQADEPEVVAESTEDAAEGDAETVDEDLAEAPVAEAEPEPEPAAEPAESDAE